MKNIARIFKPMLGEVLAYKGVFISPSGHQFVRNYLNHEPFSAQDKDEFLKKYCYYKNLEKLTTIESQSKAKEICKKENAKKEKDKAYNELHKVPYDYGTPVGNYSPNKKAFAPNQKSEFHKASESYPDSDSYPKLDIRIVHIDVPIVVVGGDDIDSDSNS